jgi:hypothetical protein
MNPPDGLQPPVIRNVKSVGKVIFRKFAINKIKYSRVGKYPKSGLFYRLVRHWLPEYQPVITFDNNIGSR